LLERARALGVDSAAIHYLIGFSQTQLGDMATAETELENCLKANPDFALAARALSKLKKQTTADNHVERLRASIARTGPGHEDAALLQYALFKELDDIGERDAAWQALDEGMRLRRRQVNHDAAAEQSLFEYLRGVGGQSEQDAEETAGPLPIFIVGMPRSGTTLLERILGAHAQVADAGELRDVLTQLRWMCDRAGPPHLDLDLAQRAENIDWSELGGRYLGHTRWRAQGRAFYTDKLPANFMHVGYIARALPRAPILHMVRDPMDTCFSNLKEHFANAYHHSYDQLEMADHYHQYRQLMAHWHARFPGRILDVHYADLVVDPERVARDVLAFCGLPWQDGIVDIDRRSGPVATASATQVREPIHQRFVEQWRRYESQLAPMRERLAFHGY
jgi:tetratricopeptide (TPR) repeat protein